MAGVRRQVRKEEMADPRVLNDILTGIYLRLEALQSGSGVTGAIPNSAWDFGTFGGTPNSRGGSYLNGVATLQPASAVFPGGLTTGAQSIGGLKTWVAPTSATGAKMAQWYGSSVLRAYFNDYGALVLQVNDGGGSEVGYAAMGTPNGVPGILFGSASTDYRSDIRHRQGAGGGGFDFAYHTISSLPPTVWVSMRDSGQVYFNAASGTKAIRLVDGGILHFSTQDAELCNLKRSGTSTLKTDGAFVVGAGLTVATASTFTLGLQVGALLEANAGVQSNSPNIYKGTTGITAFATGGQASATALTSEVNFVTTCATNLDSVKLPIAALGKRIVVFNQGAATCDVFPITGSNMDGALNTAYNIAAGASREFYGRSATEWFSR